MTDPNFLIIGAQKSGTTWLANMLRQHPDIFMPPEKELHFFDLKENYSKGIDWYRSFFSDYSGEKAIGEATPGYFSLYLNQNEIRKYGLITNIPELICDEYPGIKLILCLRDPVTRAISAYYHAIRARRISPSTPIKEVTSKYAIVSRGYYYSQLLEWLKFFPLKHFLILIYEDDILLGKKRTIMNSYHFLGVNQTFEPEGIETKYGATSNHLYMYINY